MSLIEAYSRRRKGKPFGGDTFHRTGKQVRKSDALEGWSAGGLMTDEGCWL